MLRRYTIGYLKIMTVVAGVFSLIGLFTKMFDPWGSLDGLIMTSLYGTTTMPEVAFPAFSLGFSLFCLLSIIQLIVQYAVIHFSIQKREMWGYWTLFIGWILWVIGAVFVSYNTGAENYLVSAATVAILFLPPFIILKFAK